MSNCERCGNHLSSYMTPEEFKDQFKVGDTIIGWSTRKPCKITAIGIERFLYNDCRLDTFRGHVVERVAKIRQNFLWTKAESEAQS